MQTRALLRVTFVTLAALQACHAEKERVSTGQAGQDEELLASVLTDFGFTLYRELATTRESFCLSPLSLVASLASVMPASRGKTAAELAQALRLGSLDDQVDGLRERARALRLAQQVLIQRLQAHASPEQEELRARLAALEAQLPNPLIESHEPEEQAAVRDYNELLRRVSNHDFDMATALWLDQGITLSPRFVDELRRDCGQDAIVPADFLHNSSSEGDRINAWVQIRTKWKIPQIVDPRRITRETAFILLNAVHFVGSWSHPFNSSDTSDVDFEASDENKSRVPFLHAARHEGCLYGAFEADGSFHATPRVWDGVPRDDLYPCNGGFQVLELLYRGDELSMVIILPRDRRDPAGLADGLFDAKRWTTMLEQLERRDTSVLLPKWSSATSLSLVAPMKKLGVHAAFEPGCADFSAMTMSPDDAKGLYIQAIEHQAKINVDEEGTKAAAATAVFAARGGTRGSRPFVPVFSADHPFAYVIRERRSGALLFIGRVARL